LKNYSEGKGSIEERSHTKVGGESGIVEKNKNRRGVLNI
jgi:hypothetical protein